MSKNTTKNFTIYKIFSETGLIYIGRTKLPLQTRLHGHFFKKPMHREIDIECVTKIEYANLKTEADMFLYEIYYINKFKPPLNRDDKARDLLTIELPDVEFLEYNCPLMTKWKKQLSQNDREYYEKQNKKRQIEEERLEMRRQIFSRTDIDIEEKRELYTTWLIEIYEPIRNSLAEL